MRCKTKNPGRPFGQPGSVRFRASHRHRPRRFPSHHLAASAISAEAARSRRHEAGAHEYCAGRKDLSGILQAAREAFGALDGFLDLVAIRAAPRRRRGRRGTCCAGTRRPWRWRGIRRGRSGGTAPDRPRCGARPNPAPRAPSRRARSSAAWPRAGRQRARTPARQPPSSRCRWSGNPAASSGSRRRRGARAAGSMAAAGIAESRDGRPLWNVSISDISWLAPDRIERGR